MLYQGNKTTLLNHDLMDVIISYQAAPCISLYQPTHRSIPDNQQDPIRFGNLLKNIESSLAKDYSKAEVEKYLKPFRELAQDVEFWGHTLDGLVVLGGPDFFKVITLAQTVPQIAEVGKSFYVKPLWRYLQSLDRYQILALSREKVCLYEGNRYGLEEIELDASIPKSIVEVNFDSRSETYQNTGSYGSLGSGGGPTTGGRAVVHGLSGSDEYVAQQAEKFFREVSQGIEEHYSRPSKLPLILVALPEHQHLFRSLNKNPLLSSQGIYLNPHSLSIAELKDLAWQAMEPQYKARLVNLSKDFEQARVSGRGSSDLSEVIRAAESGKVDTLLLLENRSDDSHHDNELDNLGELVAKKGGQVFVVPAGMLNSETGMAATFRY